MSRILNNNGIDNTNIDGASFNDFCAGQRSGIIKGRLNECLVINPSSSVLTMDTGELIISGVRLVLNNLTQFTFSTLPATTIRYSLVAEISIDNDSLVDRRIFIQQSDTELIQNKLFKTESGFGIYQVEIAKFSLTSDGIEDIVRTLDVITGGMGDGAHWEVGDINSFDLEHGMTAEVDIDYNEDTKEYDFSFGIPRGLQGIQGETGEQGEQGEKGEKGDQGTSITKIEKTDTTGLVDTYTITFSNNTTSDFDVINGKGIASIEKTDTTGLVDTYTITFTDLTTKDFSVNNGNGISKIEKTGTVDNVDTYTITFTDGTTTTFDITNSLIQDINGKSGAHIVLETDDVSDIDQLNKWSTAEEKEKISKIVISGDGKQALLNDGTYGEVGTVDTVNNVLPDENKNITITADDIEYDEDHSIKDELDIKVNTADIINNLMSTDTDKPLSALQGKHLKDIIDTKNFGKAFGTIANMVSDLNSASATDYRTAFNLLIVALEVPDFWITEIMESSVSYTYTTDQALIDSVGTEPVQIGFYKISKLETAKVDLTNYATKLSIGQWQVPYRDAAGSGEPNTYRLATITSPLPNAILIRDAEGKATFVGGTSANQGIVKSQLDNALSELNTQSFSKVYKSLSDLTGIDDSNTLAEVCDAMVNNSYLNISTSGYANLVPTGETDLNGQLEIIRVNANRVRLAWSYQNASRQPIYFATYRNAGGFLGWKQMITDSDTQTITGEKKFNLGTAKFSITSANNDFRIPLTSPLVTTQEKRYLLGIPSTNAPYTSTNTSAYMQNGILYSNSSEVANVSDNQTITGEKIFNNIKGVLKPFTATLSSASWTGSSAPYSKEITVSGILATDKPDIDLDLSSSTYSNVETIQTDWSKIYRAVSGAGTITFYASEVPTIDIPLQIKVVR